MSEKKKPLSLNQRNNRVIEDISASQPRKPRPLTSDAEKDLKASRMQLEGRRRLFKASTRADEHATVAEHVPPFAEISDFDLPLVEQESEKHVKVKLEGMRRLCKLSSDTDDDHYDARKKSGFGEPKFVILSDFDSPVSENNESVVAKKGGDGKKLMLNEPSFNMISDFDSPVSEKNKSMENKKGGDGKKSGFNEPSNMLSDFDLPTPENKPSPKNVDGGGNEIRDILNELSSKFDLMSIERKRIPKTVDFVGDCVDVPNKEAKSHEKCTAVPEYESASSSFSHKTDRSDSSSGLNNQSIAGGVEQGTNEVISCESNSKSIFTEVDETKNVLKKQATKETGKRAIKSKFGATSYVSNVADYDSDDDCVVMNNKSHSKQVVRGGNQFVEVSDLSDGPKDKDHYADDFDGKGDGSMTLKGPNYTYKLSGKIATMLYPHQRDGMKWLWSLHCQGKGGILGDDMGLGKTMQMCGYLAGLFSSGLIKRALIVSPKTLLPHWIKELSTVGLSDKTREYFGTSAKAREYDLHHVLQNKGVLLTTYDIVRNNSSALRGDYYFRHEDDITWDYMILDEGHLIKNPGTQRAKSLLEIPSAHRIVISGTPIQNNLKELWALFNFCCPELLGDKTWFKDKYENPILRGNDKNASDREKRIGSTVAKELRDRIQPYFLRRLKSEVFGDDDPKTAKLSKKSEMIVWLRLTSCQQQLYEAFLNSEIVLSAFDGSPLAALTILKKICDHPLLLTKRAAEDLLDGMESMLNQEDHGVAEKLAMHIADMTDIDDFQEKHDSLSCKISFILALLDDLIPQGHNVLIFSQTRKMLNLIQESLLTKGYEYMRIDGTTKASDRLKIVNDFQEGNGAPIFLLTSQVGGLGLTLTRADRVIVVDPAWNPSTDSQSVDRAYRIGQTKDVIVYRLMTCSTVEEKIYRKQIYKGGLFKCATEHKEQIRYFSQQDLKELFSLPKHGFDTSLTQQQLHEEHDSQYKMDDKLTEHINFLETLGIAGVSHHSLLFSKTAPVPVGHDEEEVPRKVGNSYRGKSFSSSSNDRNVDGAEFAFNPKDVKLYRHSISTDSGGKLTETDIKNRIHRLSLIYADKATVSKLPDKGERLQKQIDELHVELQKIQTAKSFAREVIDLDTITGSFHNVLNI